MKDIFLEWKEICRCIERICDCVEDADFDGIKSMFLDAEPADVRPVTFCRDCFANGLCSVQDILFYNDVDKVEDFFCANGRRKKMTEYIDKNTAITAVGEAIADGASWFDALERIPSADVRPVVRGRWEWRHRHRGSFRRVTGEDDFGVRRTITVDERYQIDDPYCPFCGKLNESVFLNFCPNCGAELREANL